MEVSIVGTSFAWMVASVGNKLRFNVIVLYMHVHKYSDGDVM